MVASINCPCFSMSANEFWDRPLVFYAIKRTGSSARFLSMSFSSVPDSHSSRETVYQGQFGSFTITPNDRLGVWVYRGALNGAALAFALGATLVFLKGETFWSLQMATLCYGIFWIGLGIALATIHIYMIALHRLLQAFWAIGGLASIGFAVTQSDPLVLYVYQHPFAIVGVGFSFAALTGIFFKEAFCFDRFETKILTPIVPGLLLGHLVGLLPQSIETALLMIWAIFFLVFGFRKLQQEVPGDIGDKSVFDYLKQSNPENTANP